MFSSTLEPPILLVRWEQSVTTQDVQEVENAVKEAYNQVGPRLSYVAVIPSDVPPPESSVRDALANSSKRVSSLCSSMHLVIEGQGFRRAIIRSIITGIVFITRSDFEVHTSLNDAISAAKIPNPNLKNPDFW